MTMSLTTLALLALTPILVWRIYARLAVLMRRQRSILTRHYSALIVLVAMVLVPGSELIGDPAALAWLALGTAAGIGYGIWGLRLTRFENTAEGYFFRPNARLGMLIAMLFVARVLYVGFEIYANQGSALPNPKFSDSPLNLLSVGLTAGYFGSYCVGLLRWRRALNLEKAAGT